MQAAAPLYASPPPVRATAASGARFWGGRTPQPSRRMAEEDAGVESILSRVRALLRLLEGGDFCARHVPECTRVLRSLAVRGAQSSADAFLADSA